MLSKAVFINFEFENFVKVINRDKNKNTNIICINLIFSNNSQSYAVS